MGTLRQERDFDVVKYLLQFFSAVEGVAAKKIFNLAAETKKR